MRAAVSCEAVYNNRLGIFIDIEEIRYALDANRSVVWFE